MRPYLSAFRIRFINGLQYRASALGEMLSYVGFYGNSGLSGLI